MDILHFLQALYEDWVALMGGIFSIIFTFLGLTRHRWFQFIKDNPELQSEVFLSAAVLFFLFASIRVWTKEHRQVINQRAKIYREFIEAKTRRIDLYKNVEHTTHYMLYFSDMATYYMQHQQTIQHQKMMGMMGPPSVELARFAKTYQEENAKFDGILTEITIVFGDSSELNKLIPPVKNLQSMNVKENRFRVNKLIGTLSWRWMNRFLAQNGIIF